MLRNRCSPSFISKLNNATEPQPLYPTLREGLGSVV
ncbi:MAG: hypothetical protein ACI8S6_001990 [Myxococcota bacterium]|jgi:hypothetical protein